MATAIEQPSSTTENDFELRRRDLGWYDVNLNVSIDSHPNARKLLEQWSGIPEDKVNEHINEIRTKAFKIFPYPCIGAYRFLDLSIISSPQYDEILSRVKSGEKFLDLGCCFGQEVRQLAYDGAPSENLYGSDLREEFIELGYELFRDRAKLKATFVAADVFDAESPLKQLDGQISIVYAGSFFHLFDWESQKAVGLRVVRLLKAEPGSVLVGRQVGNVESGEEPRGAAPGERKRFRHDPGSWKKLWDDICRETGTRWDVHAELDDWAFGRAASSDIAQKPRDEMEESGRRRIKFVVRRL